VRCSNGGGRASLAPLTWGGARGLPLVPGLRSLHDLCRWNLPLQRLEAPTDDEEPADDAEEPRSMRHHISMNSHDDIMAVRTRECWRNQVLASSAIMPWYWMVLEAS